MKDFIKRHMFSILFAVLGSIAGFLYWKFVGCKTGSCPIKSNWYLMTGYGLFAGYLVGDIISGIINKKRDKKDNEAS